MNILKTKEYNELLDLAIKKEEGHEYDVMRFRDLEKKCGINQSICITYAIDEYRKTGVIKYAEGIIGDYHSKEAKRLTKKLIKEEELMSA